jgi:hypothetical protein
MGMRGQSFLFESTHVNVCVCLRLHSWFALSVWSHDVNRDWFCALSSIAAHSSRRSFAALTLSIIVTVSYCAYYIFQLLGHAESFSATIKGAAPPAPSPRSSTSCSDFLCYRGDDALRRRSRQLALLFLFCFVFASTATALLCLSVWRSAHDLGRPWDPSPLVPYENPFLIISWCFAGFFTYYGWKPISSTDG